MSLVGRLCGSDITILQLGAIDCKLLDSFMLADFLTAAIAEATAFATCSTFVFFPNQC